MGVQVLGGVLRFVIRLRSESGQAFVVDVDLQWVDVRHEDIHSEVEFVPVDQQWIGYVPAHDALLSRILQLAQTFDDVDAFALRTLGWLDDPQVAFSLLILCLLTLQLLGDLLEAALKEAMLVWKQEGLWHEVEVVVAILVAHPVDVVSELVLVCELNGIQEVVDFLMLLQLFVDLWLVVQTHTCPQKAPLVLVGLVDALAVQNLLEYLRIGVHQLEEDRFRICVVAPRHVQLLHEQLLLRLLASQLV